jgi:hypothetical protein
MNVGVRDPPSLYVASRTHITHEYTGFILLERAH